MAKKTILLFVLIAISFTSCDPGIGLAITNKTETEKRIKVIYPANFKFPGDIQYSFGIRDSIKTYDLNKAENYQHPFVVPRLSWDTIAMTYSFNLKANYSATIESRFLASAPTYGQVFIIDNKDTVELKRHGKIFSKKPKLTLGGTWTYIIKDQK
ncbi:hypothetical protein [Limnovirga soli]|uniref:Lipoprotein n=1 Tax=Limnovirga soli TaxID=2656915 RepID=A0A8J8JT49_9BACT|nr:hypothetical protein [Limnovirga soli]NNV54259.1 hypothetical protein [Limnovirga soli]